MSISAKEREEERVRGDLQAKVRRLRLWSPRVCVYWFVALRLGDVGIQMVYKRLRSGKVITPTAIQIEPYTSHVGGCSFCVCPSSDTLGRDHEF